MSESPFCLQVPDRDITLYVGLSGHRPRHLSVCGGSSLVSTRSNSSEHNLMQHVQQVMHRWCDLVAQNAQAFYRITSSFLRHSVEEMMHECGSGKSQSKKSETVRCLLNGFLQFYILHYI